MERSGWFGVRCVFRTVADDGDVLYEERVTVWLAADADQALELASTDAEQYANDVDAEYLGFAQSFAMVGAPSEGVEVFSLMRTSSMNPAEYLNTYFDTGTERQTHQPDEPFR